MKKLFLLSCFFILTSCEDTLDKITLAAENLKKCEVSQKYPDECSKYKRELEILLNTAIKEGFENDRIDAARNLGSLNIEGETSKSPYRTLTDNLSKEISDYPLRIPLEHSNYEAYWNYCYENKLEKVKETDDQKEVTRKLALVLNEESRIDKYVVKLGYIVTNNHLNVIVTSFSGCIPGFKEEEKIEAAKNIVLVSKEQIIDLDKGKYISSNPVDLENKPGNQNYKYYGVTVFLALGFDDADEIYKILSGNTANPYFPTEEENSVLRLARDNFLKNVDDDNLK